MVCPDTEDMSIDSTSTRLEFIILVRKWEEMVEANKDGVLEWDILDQDTFDNLVSEAVYLFAKEADWIHTLA